eukprot:73993-Chlamydomonas_euryale.AAC.1
MTRWSLWGAGEGGLLRTSTHLCDSGPHPACCVPSRCGAAHAAQSPTRRQTHNQHPSRTQPRS